MKLVGYQQPTCLCVKMEFVVGTISLSCELFSLFKARAGLKPMYLMQIHWASRRSGSRGERLGRSPPPKTYESTFIRHDFVQSQNSIRDIRRFCRQLFCGSSVVKYASSLLQ